MKARDLIVKDVQSFAALYRSRACNKNRSSLHQIDFNPRAGSSRLIYDASSHAFPLLGSLISAR